MPYRVELTGSDYEKHLQDKKLAIKEDEAALEAEMEFAQELRSGDFWECRLFCGGVCIFSV